MFYLCQGFFSRVLASKPLSISSFFLAGNSLICVCLFYFFLDFDKILIDKTYIYQLQHFILKITYFFKPCLIILCFSSGLNYTLGQHWCKKEAGSSSSASSRFCYRYQPGLTFEM